MTDNEQTVHLLRADGITDHFRLERRFVDLELVPVGNRLLLAVVHEDETNLYGLNWH